jgi:hypothetical protein
MYRFKTAVSEPSEDEGVSVHEAPRSGLAVPRTQTVEFALAGSPRRRLPDDSRLGRLRSQSISRSDANARGVSLERVLSEDRRSGRRTSMYPTNTMQSAYSTSRTVHSTKHSGFGGFPMPHEIATSLMHRFFPNLHSKLTRTVTVPMTATLTSHAGPGGLPGGRTVSYITFDTIVGRNSAFPMLTGEQLEELGGVEYRALNALLWLIPIVWFLLLPRHYWIIAHVTTVPLRHTAYCVCDHSTIYFIISLEGRL